MLQVAWVAPPVQAALDPVGWIIAAIIIFNLLSPLFIRRRRPQPTQPTPAQPKSPAQSGSVLKRISSTLRRSPSPAPPTVASVQADEEQRTRQALATALQQTYRKGTSSLPPIAATMYKAPPPVPMIAPTLPAALEVPVMPASTDGLQLMTLESGLTAFDRLVGSATAARTSDAQSRIALITGPFAAANAFVAAAIVGPCAALRPLGHTPAGW